MPRKKLAPPEPPVDQIEQDFLDAFERLKSGTPRHPKLKMPKKKGTIKVNATTVALEAGHSRTLIALVDCRYPRVRDKIQLAKGIIHAEPTTHSELIDRLRGDKADLMRQLKRFRDEATAHFLARVKAEKELSDLRVTHARELKATRASLKVVPIEPNA